MSEINHLQEIYPPSTQAWSPIDDFLYSLTLWNRPNLFSLERTLIRYNNVSSADLTGRNKTGGLRDVSVRGELIFLFFKNVAFSFIYKIFQNDVFVGQADRWKRMNIHSPTLMLGRNKKKIKSKEKQWIHCGSFQLSLDHSVGQEALRLHFEDPLFKCSCLAER